MPFLDPKRRLAYLRKWTLQRRTAWLRANGPCARCGSKKNLEIDHRDPSTKLSHNVWTWSDKRRKEELAKCQVLCGSCHKKKTKEDQIAKSMREGKTVLCPRKPHLRSPSDFDVDRSGRRYRYCRTCRNRNLRQAKRVRQKRCINNRCMGCGAPSRKNLTHCEKCQRINTRNKSISYRRRLS